MNRWKYRRRSFHLQSLPICTCVHANIFESSRESFHLLILFAKRLFDEFKIDETTGKTSAVRAKVQSDNPGYYSNSSPRFKLAHWPHGNVSKIIGKL